MIAWLRRLLFGRPLETARQKHERLPKFLALPVFASDAVSSVAYGPEEVLIALAVVGNAVWSLSFPIGVFIVILIGIVAISYRQTIHAYPQGGGSYTVAKENLGKWFGLVAAASLLTDYVLTVAVSIAAGIQALVALEPSLYPYRTEACVLSVAIIALANLRGLRESGTLFAPPTYLFIACLYTVVIAGLFKVFTAPRVEPIVPYEFHLPVLNAVGIFIILRAFSSGCSALTGIEAIANGIPAFKPPESRNAATTMSIMAFILGSLVLGISYLAHVYHALPGAFILEHSETLKNLPNYDVLKDQTLVAQLTEHIFGRGMFYAVTQIATMLILVLAANTAFQDFPRLSSILARDRFAPRQLANVGDRLVFSNGIIMLSLFAILLLVIFQGSTTLLIPLYAVGVFISFTLSQWGMAVRQRMLREKLWKLKSAISAVGGTITGIVAIVIATTKFLLGAWIVIIVIPMLVFAFHKINQHYRELADQLRITEAVEPKPIKSTAIVLAPGIHKGILQALEYARTLSHDCRGLYIEIDPNETPLIRDRWERFGLGIPLVILESPYRSVVGPVLDYLEEAKKERPDHVVTVVIPEFVPVKWWHKLLHNQSGFFLKWALMFRRDLVVTNVRYYLEK